MDAELGLRIPICGELWWGFLERLSLRQMVTAGMGLERATVGLAGRPELR